MSMLPSSVANLTLLAIDTVLEGCSVALLQNEQLFSLYEYAPKQQTEKILAMVQEILQKNAVPLAQIQAFAFGQGPANFTGLRIAAALIQALAYAENKPVIGISTLQSMAQGAYREHGANQVLVCVDAQRDEIYFNLYQLNDQQLMQAIAPDRLCTLATLATEKFSIQPNCIGVGSAWQRYAEKLRTLFSLPEKNIFANFQSQAQDIARLAQMKFLQGETIPAEQALPIYLREQTDWKKI